MGKKGCSGLGMMYGEGLNQIGRKNYGRRFAAPPVCDGDEVFDVFIPNWSGPHLRRKGDSAKVHKSEGEVAPPTVIVKIELYIINSKVPTQLITILLSTIN